uniref:Actin-binding Rho-activating protein n=1 Tax=Cynoglossus semilaevis TaxID=244447 RepID=A0A3P8VPN1_CYNSE
MSAQRKPSTNRNIKKLRTITKVCGLASSWQQWIRENEKKQASEPTGWCPYSEAPEEPKRTWAKVEKVPTSAESPENVSLIKTKQVVKTVTSSVTEKSVGVGLLAEKIKKETLPSDEEIDRLLTKKTSPTRRRKCSNMVASLTKSWKQVENEQKQDRDRDGASEPQDSQGDTVSTVRIKRAPVSAYKKEAEDANKINALSKKYSPVGNLKSRWQNWASEHTVNQKLNPFSEYFDYDYSMSLRLQKGEEGYGRPKEGTKTAERAKRAEQHIHREIADMCYVIRTMADPDADGKTRITFGELFDRYVRISDKVVGILMRARKHGKVEFEGEMLWQGQDDGVIITLLV